MRTQNENDGEAEFGSIRKQTESENKKLARTGMIQMQPDGAIEAEHRHNRGANSDVG